MATQATNENEIKSIMSGEDGTQQPINIDALRHIYGDDELTKEDVLRSKALTTDEFHLTKELIGTLFAVAITTFSLVWGFAVAASVLTFINADIGPSENAAVFAIIWQICVVISSLLFGRLSDKFGRRPFVLACALLGVVGAAIAATAQTMNVLIGANVLIGLGAGPSSLYILIVGELVPHRLKAYFVPLVYFGTIIPVGFGSYLGRLIYEELAWRDIYWIQLALQIAALILFGLFYRPPTFKELHGPNRTYWKEIKRIDFLGLFLFTAGATLFILAIAWAGPQNPWDSTKIVAMIASGGATLVIFVLWEHFGHRSGFCPVPLVPLHMFSSIKGYSSLTGIGIVSGVLYTAVAAIVWPYTTQTVFGLTQPRWQATAWLGSTAGFATWAGLALFLPILKHIGHTRYAMWFMLAWTTAFVGGMSTINRTNPAAGAALSFLACIFIGLLESLPLIYVQLVCDESELGIAAGVLSATRVGAGALFASVFTTILNNKLPGQIQEKVVPAVLGAGLPATSLEAFFAALTSGSAAAFATIPGISPSIIGTGLAALGDSYAGAFKYVYYAALALCVVGCLVAAFMPSFDEELKQSHVTRSVYSRKEHTTVNEALDEKVTVAHTEHYTV